MTIPAPDFPVLDSARTEPGRVVVKDLDSITPRIDETDWWCRMPVRLVINQGAGWCLEIGPYEVDEHDIETLRAAIAAYDAAARPSDEYRPGAP